MRFPSFLWFLSIAQGKQGKQCILTPVLLFVCWHPFICDLYISWIRLKWTFKLIWKNAFLMSNYIHVLINEKNYFRKIYLRMFINWFYSWILLIFYLLIRKEVFFLEMPKKSGKKGKGKGKKKAKKTIAGAEDIVHSLLKSYERNCGLTESQISPRIKSALRACKENETVLSTVCIYLYMCLIFC